MISIGTCVTITNNVTTHDKFIEVKLNKGVHLTFFNYSNYKVILILRL